MGLRWHSRLLVAGAAVLILLSLAAVDGITYWAVGPSWRCWRPDTGPAPPGWSARVVVSGGRQRCYHLYVPPGYDQRQPAPVVVSLHGFLSNPESQALISGWHKVADRENFLVAYPQGTSFPQRWNAFGSWGANAVDDVQFFRDLLEDLSQAVAPPGGPGVDRRRVYVNGFSNGGGMSVRIGCEAADVVAAIGSVAGAVVDLQNCNPSRPVPAMAFHGTDDPIVSYYGGDIEWRWLHPGAQLTGAPTQFIGAQEWVAAWAANNSCDPSPETIPTGSDAVPLQITGIHYVNCQADADVVLYTIEGGGHTWPGGWPIPVVGRTSRNIDATEEMWAFYQVHPLKTP